MCRLQYFLVLLIIPTSFAISINEIMYDVNGTDTGHEWIEIYNNDSEEHNLTGWKFFESGTNHAISLVQGSEILNMSGFAVIADNPSTFLADYPSYNGTLFDSCFSLSNTGESLALKNSSLNVVENVSYLSDMGGDGNGFSLCRMPDGNESFIECSPTPGASNSLSNNTNTTANATAELNCDLSISIEAGDTIFSADNAVEFNLTLNDTNCNQTSHPVVVDYFVDDLFGNYVKSLLNTTRTMTCYTTIERQWTPDSISGSEAYYIKANITNTTCNDTNAVNNYASKMIIVKGNTLSKSSTISITDVDAGSDNEIKYGETADIEIQIYRGDTGKYAVDVWVYDSDGNKISTTSTIHAKSKFTAYKLQIPLQLKPNCDGKFNDGAFTLTAEGLDTSDARSIAVKGVSSSNCKTVTVSSSGGSSYSGGSSTAQPKITSYEITKYSTDVEEGKEFTTSIMINNSFTTAKNFTVYSYVFKGNNPVSLGPDSKNSWKATYTANAVSFILNPSESRILELKNKIEDGTESGVYSLRVRIKVDGKDNDITKEIIVKGKNKSASGNTINITESSNATINTTTNRTSTNKTSIQAIRKTSSNNFLTGLAAVKPSNLLSSPLTVFLKMLFGF
jgi:hypothetical protein